VRLGDDGVLPVDAVAVVVEIVTQAMHVRHGIVFLPFLLARALSRNVLKLKFQAPGSIAAAPAQTALQ
jgi:hypothetical protein